MKDKNIFKGSKLFYWTLEILAVVLLFFLLTQVKFIFKPIVVLFSAVFIPLLIAGFLYYVFDPIIRFFGRKIKMPRIVGILISVLLVIGAYVYIFASVIPAIINQLTGLINSSIKAYPSVQKWVIEVANSKRFHEISNQINLPHLMSQISSSYTTILKNILDGVSLSVGSVVGFITSLIFVLILVPIFFYYLLKDGSKILPFLKRNVLKNDKYGVADLLHSMNATLSKYIFGLAIDVTFIFVMALIGYLVIGIPYAFIFALFSGVTTLIPYLGPYIGVAPVVLTVAWSHPWEALFAVAYILIVQQIDGNLIYPRIVGSAVNIHPVTVMVLMLVMGNLYGILGMVVAVPGYALVKEIVKFIISLYQNIRAGREKNKTDNPVI